LDGSLPKICQAVRSFNQDIGSVVSEEKIFFKFHPPFFLFLAWWPSWLEVGITGYNFGRGPSKDHSTKVLLQLAQWFLRRKKLKIEKREDEIKKKSSPLKLLSQSQPNFAEMILGWSSSKGVSGISELRPRWLSQPNLI
jgi:hypothetical protein